jgi:hypothetical protein
MLIKSKIAEPLNSVPELLESLDMSCSGNGRQLPEDKVLCTSYRNTLGEDKVRLMSRLLTEIRRTRGITLEELSEIMGMGYAATAELASILETDGFITIDLLQRCCINVSKK